MLFLQNKFSGDPALLQLCREKWHSANGREETADDRADDPPDKIKAFPVQPHKQQRHQPAQQKRAEHD